MAEDQSGAGPNENGIGQTFLECVDVLEKIKRFKQENMKGTTKHFYTVKRLQGGGFRSPSTPRLQSSARGVQASASTQNPTTDPQTQASEVHPTASQSALPVLPKLNLPPVLTIRRAGFPHELSHSAQIREHKTQRDKLGGRQAFLKMQLEPISMVQVEDPASQTLYRTQWKSKQIAQSQSQRNFGLVKTIRIGSSAAPSEQNSVDQSSRGARSELAQSARTIRSEMPGFFPDSSLHDRDLGKLKLVDAVQLELGIAQEESATDANHNQSAVARARQPNQGFVPLLTAAMMKTKLPQGKSSSRLDRFARRSFLRRVLESTNIVPPAGGNFTGAEIEARQRQLLESIAGPQDHFLFEDFLNGFGEMLRLFGSFRVKEIFNFKELPLEQFGQPPDAEKDILLRLEKSKNAMSRWIDGSGQTSWKPCIVESYDINSGKFTINWTGGQGSTKQVSRLNIVLEGEDVTQFDDIKKRATAARCEYLLQQSIKDTLLSKDALADCRVYFGVDQFKNLMIKSNLYQTTADSPELTGKLAQDILEEYALGILRFFALYKSSPSYDHFLDQIGGQGGHSIGYIESKPVKTYSQIADYQIVESTTSVLEPYRRDELSRHAAKGAVVSADKPQLVATCGRTMEGTGAVLDSSQPQQEVLVAQLDHVFYKAILSFGGYNLSADQKLLVLTGYQRKLSQNLVLPQTPSEVSLDNSSIANQGSQTVEASPGPYLAGGSASLPAISTYIQESAPTFTMGTIRTTNSLATLVTPSLAAGPSPCVPSPRISPHIHNLAILVSSQLLQPLDLYLGHMALNHSAIRDIEQIDVFAKVTVPLGGGDGKLKEVLGIEAAERSLKWVQENLGMLRDEYVSLLEFQGDQSKVDFSSRFLMISKSLNQQLKLSIQNMLANSCSRLQEFLEKWALTLSIEREYQDQIDFLLSKETYILKCKGQSRFCLVPDHKDSSIHPRKLEVFSSFRRRVALFMSYVGYFLDKTLQDDLKIQQKCMEGSHLFGVCIATVKVVQRGAGKQKKGDAATRGRVRADNREKIYRIHDYFALRYDAVVREISNLTTAAGLSFSAEEFSRLELNQVVFGMLSDFNCEFGAFEFRPGLAKIEREFKEAIRGAAKAVEKVPRLGTGKDLAAPDNAPIPSPEAMPKVLHSMDHLLSDSFILLLSFMYALQSFSHLLPTDKSLVHEELKQLLDNDQLDPLEVEVHQLLRDKQTLEHLFFPGKDKLSPKWTVGSFSVDCQEIIRSMLNNIDDCVKKVFDPHVYKKFDSLIANNKGVFQELRERLLSPVTDIERYIEMKRFVEGEELTTMIEGIRHDIKLCRRLNKFEEETRFMSDLITNDYLESLSWVTELTHLQEAAQHRIKKALPQFKEELVRIQERLVKEFEQTKSFIKEFDNYSDDQEAETYHIKARELNSTLESYLTRALDLNSKQEIIGMKKSTLDVQIQNEKAAFSRYLDLWSFIDNEWNVNHESWKKEPFYKLDKADMANVIGNGLALLRRLQEGFKDNEVITKLVRSKQNEVNKFNKVLEVVKILKDPSFKDRHWDDLFLHIKEADNNDVLGLREGRPDLTKITLGQLMLANIVSYLHILKMIEIKANIESDIELRIKKIRMSVESIVIKPTIFDLDGSGLSIITKIREINMELNDHLTTCLNMLANPECPEELVKELKLLTNLLTITTKAFTYIQSVQQKLIKFSPIFKFKELERFLTRKDTTSQFLRLREEFKKVLGTLEEKKIGFFTDLVTSEEDDSKEDTKANEFLAKLQSFNSTSDSISQSLTTFFKMIRLQSPRYFYTTDEQMLTLCSLIKFPRSFIGFITTLFRGLQSVSTGNVIEGGESDSVEIVAVTNSLGEIMRFRKGSVIDLASNAEIPLISIVKELERQTAGFLEKERKNSLVSIANLHFDFGMIYHHWNDKHITWQTMSVCVHALFDMELAMILRNPINTKPPTKGPSPFSSGVRKSIMEQNPSEPLIPVNMLKTFKKRLTKSLHNFVQYPIRYLKDKLRDATAVTIYNGYILMVQSLIDNLNYLEEAGVQSYEDFAYQMVPKYSVTFDNEQKFDQASNTVVEDELEQDIQKHLRHPEVIKHDQFLGCYTTYTPLVEDYMVKKGQKLVLSMMGHSLDYKYEVMNVTRHTNAWPLLERTVFSMWLAMCTCPHIIVKGFKSQGKLETLRALNQKVAANYFECDMSFGNDISLVNQYIYGMISGGYWLVFKNMERAPPDILSVLASFANEVRQSLAAKRTKIRVNDQELLIMGSHLILCTYNLDSLDSSRKFEELSTNITDQFRIITIYAPNFQMIVSGLVSAVFDSEEDKASWVSKLLYYCKTYRHAEINVDLQGEIKGTLMTEEEHAQQSELKKMQRTLTVEKDFLPVPASGLEETSVTSKLPEFDSSVEFNRQQEMPEVTLRELGSLLSRSVVKYFKAIAQYYDSFKEKDGTYRIDVQILQLNQERTAKFTQIFRQELLAWLEIYGPTPLQTQAQRILFDKLFAEDLNKQRTGMPSAVVSQRDAMLKLISVFKEIEPKCNLPDEDKKTAKILEGYVDAFASCESGRQMIIFGEPNTQKSTLIKLLGLLESEKTNTKFSQYWLNLECLGREDVFGNSKSPGILREILLQTNNINLEEKTTAVKLKYLFESSTMLYQTAVDPRSNKDGKIKKSLEHQNSWVVVDANSSKSNVLFYARVNYLMRIFSNLYEMKEVNQFIGFSSKLKVVYELNSLAELDPSNVSSACVIYVRKGLLSVEDRLVQWSRDLGKQHAFFKTVMPKVTDILSQLVLPLVSDLEEEAKHQTNKPAFAYSQRLSFLNSLLGYMEIFLNEFRKMYLALGLFEARRNPDTDLALKKLSAGPQGKSSKPEQFSFGSGMKLAQEAGVSMIAQQRSKKTTVRRDDDHVSSLKTIQDIEDFERRKIEGIAVFCFITTAYPQIFCDQHNLLKTLIEKHGAAYCAKNSINKNLFADGLFSMIADKKIGGILVDLSHFLYDFTKGRWVTWESVKTPNKVVVTSSFSSETFTKSELTRLNCQNTDAFMKAESSANEEVFTFINSVEKSLVPTSNVNHMRYMLDLLLNYKRHVLLMSDHQQGKSSFLGNVYFRDLIECREIVTFNFVLQKGVSAKTIQKQMEDNLLGSGKNVVRPPQNKRVIVWIDDLQMSNDEEKPESLVRCLQVQEGWFSSNKKTFIKIEDCQFLMTFSGTEYNKEATRMSLNSLNSDVLSKCLLLKTHKMTLPEVDTIFFDQVKSNVDPNPSSETEKLISRLFHQLAKVVYFNQDTLKSLSGNSLVNLNLESFNQLTRSMSLVDWEDLSERPADVLFAWYKTIMSFLSCDFNFQKAEFEIIIKEKHSKMNLIKAARRSSLFQTVKNQRLSVKLNAAVLEQLQAQYASKNSLSPEGANDSSNSLGVKAKLLRKSSRMSILPAEAKKNLDMHLIKEEDHEDQDDEDGKASQRHSKRKSMVGESLGDISVASRQPKSRSIAPGSQRGSLIPDKASPSQASDSGARLSQKNRSQSHSVSKSFKAESVSRNKLLEKHGMVLRVLGPDGTTPKGTDLDLPKIQGDNKSAKSSDKSSRHKSASKEPAGTFLGAKKSVLEKSASLYVDTNAKPPAARDYFSPKVGGRGSMALSRPSPVPGGQRRKSSSNLSGRDNAEGADKAESNKELSQQDESSSDSGVQGSTNGGLGDQARGSARSINLGVAPPETDVRGSARSLLVPDSPKSQAAKSGRSVGGRSAASSQDASQITESKTTSEESEEQSQTAEEEHVSEESKHESIEELSDENNATEEAKEAFRIDPLLPTNVFFRKFIEKTMDFKLPGKTKLEELARSACFEMKFLFDQVLLKEMKDSKERKEDNDDHTFFVPDKRGEQELMEFFKSTVFNFIKSHPDALIWLKLDGGNFPLFVHHFSMLSMSLLTDFQQLYISAVKSLHYVKSMIQYIGSCLRVTVDYIDLLAGNCRVDEHGNITKADAYEYLRDVIVSAFADIWRLKKRIIIIHVPNSSANAQNVALLDRVLELVSSLVLNTDSIQLHLGDHLKEMVDSAKKDKLYQHYSEFELRFTIRNRFQAKTIFVLMNDCTQTYMSDAASSAGAASLAADQSSSFYMYLTEQFSKLSTKFNKLVVNGLKCLEPEDTPKFFQPLFRVEEVEIDKLCARHMNTELNFLRCIDLEKEYFCLVRPFTETVVLYNSFRNAIRLRLSSLEADSASPDCVRDKSFVVQRIEKRKEVLALEIKEIDSQIETKTGEREGVVAQELELQQRKENWTNKKADCRETIGKLHFSMAELIKEEGLYQDLKQGLQETLKSIREFRDKDLVQGIHAGYFTRSKSFAVYSVIFCETSKQMVVNDLKEEELYQINEDNIDRNQVQDYITIFEETISNFGSKFADALGAPTANTLSEKKCKFFCSLIEKMRVGIEDPTVVSQMQRAVLRVIDTCIESIRLEQEKERRELEMQQLRDSISMLETQVERCSSFLSLIDKELAEQPELIAKIDSRIEHLRKLKQTDLGCIQTLTTIVQSLAKFQADFERITQPLQDPTLNKDELADMLAGLVAIYSKYPFEIKKKLMFISMESTSLPGDIFNRLSPHELLTSAPLVVDIMRQKIPCNANSLINLAVVELLQEEQTFPFPLILDQAKLFLKYLSAKNNKALVVERLCPGPQVQEQLEMTLRSGGVYVALDPDDEHLRLLRPIIDWQFRRFGENVILNSQQQLETTDHIMFFGKKITVNKNFYLFVVLEGMHVAKVEQSILSKLLVLDNSVMSETGFCETLGDELSVALDSLARGFQISEYTSKSLLNVVAQQYRTLLQKGREFDFLRDSLESSGFLVFQNEASKFERVVRDYDKDQEERRASLREYQNKQKELFKVVLPTMEDERQFHFLNCPFGYKVADYIKIAAKHLKFASQFWPYFYALNLMRSFLGEAFSVGYDLIAHMVKQNLVSLEMKYQLAADPEKRSETTPALFNEAERQVYFSLKNCLPARFQYIFSFLLSVITLQRKYSMGTEGFRRMSIMPMLGNPSLTTDSQVELTPQKGTTDKPTTNSWTTLNGLSQLLNQFFWSERVLGRNTKSLPFSSVMYAKFNKTVKELGNYFQDTQELLPLLLPRTKDSCKLLSELTEQVDETYKHALDAFRDVDHQERLLSQMIGMQFQKEEESSSDSSDQEEMSSPTRSELGSPELKKKYSISSMDATKTELSMKLTRINSFDSRIPSSRKEIQKFTMPGPEPLQNRLYLREVVPYYSQEGLARQLAAELDFVYSDMKPKEFSGQRLSYDQIVLLLKSLITQIPSRTNLQLQIHSSGDPVFSLLTGLGNGTPAGGAEAERRASKLLLQSSSGSKKKSIFQSMFFAGLSQASAQNKLVNLNLESRKSLKNFAQIIVEKNKAQKATGQDFSQMFVDYIQEIMSKVFGFNIKFTPEDMDWNQFLMGAKIPKGQTNPEFHDQECPPLLPELPKEVNNWHMMGRLAVVKYARPDWIESFLTHSYSEIKGKEYLYSNPSLDHIYLASTSKRCSVILYQRIDRSPVITLERLASKTTSKIFNTMNALRMNIEDFISNVDNANKRGNWIIVENLHLVNHKQSSLMIKEAQNIIDKGASPGFRIWLLYKIQREHLEIGTPGNSQLLPTWLSSCQYSFLDEADSVREELRHLHYMEISQYSSSLNTEITQNLSKMTFNELVLGTGLIQNPSIGIVAPPEQIRSRLGSYSTSVVEVPAPDKPSFPKPKIMVQLPSDFLAATQQPSKPQLGALSPTVRPAPKPIASGSSTTRAAGTVNPSRFGATAQKASVNSSPTAPQGNNLTIPMPEPATPSKPEPLSPTRLLSSRTISTDLMAGFGCVHNLAVGSAFADGQLKKRCSNILKLIAAVFRQRRKHLEDLLGEESVACIEFTIPKDRQLDQILASLLELAVGQHSRGVILTATRSFLAAFFGDSSRLHDAVASPLLALQFIRAFLLESPPRADVNLEYSASRPYSVPSISTSEQPGKVFFDHLLSLPTEDSTVFIGFRQNEQAIMDFNRSKKAFAFLLQNIGNRLDFNVSAPGNEDEGPRDGTVPQLTHKTSIVQESPNNEPAVEPQDSGENFYLGGFIKDNKRNAKNIVGRFFLNHIEYGYNLILNHEFNGELKSDLRSLIDNVILTLGDSSISSIQGVVDLQNSQEQQQKKALYPENSNLARGSSFGPAIARSSSKLMAPASPYHPEEMLAKVGYKPNNQGKMYLILNAQENNVRSKARKYLISREWALLGSVILFIKEELQIARMYLNGDALVSQRQHARDIVEAISCNKVPRNWSDRLRGLNVSIANFKSTIQSVFVRIDSLYSLAVDSYPRLPPIINMGRLVSPQTFLLQVLQFNSQVHNVSLVDSVVMLFPKQSDKHKVYSNSTSWTVRGLKIRGGKVDDSSKLVPENPGEYESDIGPMHLEITQFPRDKKRHLEGESHIPIVLNTEYEEEPDPELGLAGTLKKWLLQAEYADGMVEARGSKEQLDHMAAALCPGSLRRQVPLPSENASGAQTSRFKTAAPGGFTSALGVPPKIRDFGQIMKEGASPFAKTPTRGSVLGIPQKSEEAKPNEYKVRLPLECGFSYNPLTQMRFYVYFRRCFLAR